MTGHVAPEVWADAFAGRLGDDERAVLDRHAEACARCARVRARVATASDSFASIRTQPAPELPWDSVRARVHWSVSKERRSRPLTRPRRLRWEMPRSGSGWVALALGLAAAATLTILVGPELFSMSSPPAPEANAPAPSSAPRAIAAAPTVRPAALAGLVNRSTGEVLIDGAHRDDLFAHRLAAGTVIATGEGSLDVQFGAASAFALGPHSTLELRRFDAEAIELAVTGTVDVDVAPRTSGQRFLVIAGEHTIEVRGTQFRVRHEAAATTVACRHGLVAVRDLDVQVGAARRLTIAAGTRPASDRVAALSVAELAELADATPYRLPLWDVDALVRGSAPLEIAATGGREVRVDGLELGRAPLAVRVMTGRHTVEAADSAGRFRRAGWIDVAAPSPGASRARLEVPAESPRTAGTSARRRELQAGIDHARLANCTRSIAKAGLSGTYVQIELAVDVNGAVGFLNVLDTDLPSGIARCVRDALADVRFRAGAPATWRERIEL